MESWKKISDPETLFSKYGKSIRRQNFENPITKETEEFILFGPKDWSVILAITEKEEVIIVRQFKQGSNKITTELVCGTADIDGESPTQLIERELLEETGYKTETVTPLGSYWIHTRASWTRFHCFLGTNCTKVAEPKEDPSEEIRTELVPLNEWLTMVQSGDIEEPSSVVATFRALPHLGFTLTRR